MKLTSILGACILLTQFIQCPAMVDDSAIGRILAASGNFERNDTPVSISLDEITSINESELAFYELVEDELVPVEVQFSTDGERRMHWILKGYTAAGETRIFELRNSTAFAGAREKKVERDRGSFILYSGGKPVMQYNAEFMPAPAGEDPAYGRSGYIHPLYTPDSTIITEVQPADHFHHYGLWNPWTMTIFRGEEVDFWNLAKKQGTVRFGGVASVNEGPVYGSVRVIHNHVAWPGSPRETIAMNEIQDMKVYNRENVPFMIDISAQYSPVEKLLLEEYRYGGFTLRATSEWTNKNSDFFTSRGLTRNEADGERAEWCILTGETETGRAGIMMMGHTSNYNHPEPLRVWPENGNNNRGDHFINFSATRNTAWELEEGTTYLLRYRLIIFEGELGEETAARLWNDYANPPSITWESEVHSDTRGKWDNRTGEIKGVNLLLFTKVGDGGFVHESIPETIKAFRKLAEQHDFTLDVTDDPSDFNDANLKDYHAVIFANSNNDVFGEDSQKQSLMNYVQAGGGVVGVHIAVGTERNWPWFKKMIGATFDRHPPYQKFNVSVVDRKHPSARHLPGMWTIEDEPYYLKEYNPEVRVILAHDLSSINDTQGKPEVFGNQYPSSWCNTFDGGRQWYTGYGHDDKIYSDPVFMQHILGGIRWVIADGLPEYNR